MVRVLKASQTFSTIEKKRKERSARDFYLFGITHLKGFKCVLTPRPGSFTSKSKLGALSGL
jgi:hypothetical protein